MKIEAYIYLSLTSCCCPPCAGLKLLSALRRLKRVGRHGAARAGAASGSVLGRSVPEKATRPAALSLQTTTVVWIRRHAWAKGRRGHKIELNAHARRANPTQIPYFGAFLPGRPRGPAAQRPGWRSCPRGAARGSTLGREPRRHGACASWPRAGAPPAVRASRLSQAPGRRHRNQCSREAARGPRWRRRRGRRASGLAGRLARRRTTRVAAARSRAAS